MSANTNDAVLARLASSHTYRDYERAFCELTGLPLKLTPAEDWHLAHRDRHHESPFCALLSKVKKGYAVCLRHQDELTTGARRKPNTTTRFSGLVETAIPLKVEGQLIGFLRTGEVLLHPPTVRDFCRVLGQLEKAGVKASVPDLRKAYFQTRVVTPKKYRSILNLLHIFAQHLSILARQIVLQSENSEPPNIVTARHFIKIHHGEQLSLSTISQQVQMTRFHFCKAFKKATGYRLTDYVSRVRVEKARELLLKPFMRVSEVAFDVGFQSLTNFNRAFKRLNGESPTSYRTRQRSL